MNVDDILKFKPQLNDEDIVYRREEKRKFQSIAFNSAVRNTPLIFNEIDIKIIGLFNGENTIFDIIGKLNNRKNFNDILKNCIEICELFRYLDIGNFRGLS